MCVTVTHIKMSGEIWVQEMCVTVTHTILRGEIWDQLMCVIITHIKMVAKFSFEAQNGFSPLNSLNFRHYFLEIWASERNSRTQSLFKKLIVYMFSVSCSCGIAIMNTAVKYFIQKHYNNYVTCSFTTAVSIQDSNLGGVLNLTLESENSTTQL